MKKTFHRVTKYPAEYHGTRKTHALHRPASHHTTPHHTTTTQMGAVETFISFKNPSRVCGAEFAGKSHISGSLEGDGQAGMGGTPRALIRALLAVNH